MNNYIGFDGFQGKIGNIGPNGIMGITGPRGFQGAAGNVGYPGINGVKGSKGITGPKGFVGFKGFDGLKGSDGPIGPPGPTGPPGPQGDAGIFKRGPVGRNGYDGFLTTYKKGKIDKLLSIPNSEPDNEPEPSSDPKSTYSDPLTSRIYMPLAPSSDAYCPAIPGTKINGVVNGLVGIANIQGSRFFQLSCQPINMIYSDNFFKRKPSYVFNPEDFYQGNLGSNGPNGFDGVRGYQGVPGPKGPVGNLGPHGPNGFNGMVGAEGPIGDRGPRGDRGISGKNGIQGDQGLAGPPGENGDKGLRGPSYVGKQGLYGYPGKVTVNYDKCLPIQPSSTPQFNCPTNYWLTGMHTDSNKNYYGVCCPYLIYDDVNFSGNIESTNIYTKSTTYSTVYADKNGKPYPKANEYTNFQIKDSNVFKNIYNINPILPLNFGNYEFGYSVYDLQGLYQNDIRDYYKASLD